MKCKYILILILAIICNTTQAIEWKSYFAYNNITNIAVTPEKVFALSDGALFSVDIATGDITKYDSQSGLHANGLTYICYDDAHEQLILVYSSGKIDIMTKDKVKYISGLYDKDMTSNKNVNNVTLHNGYAYLSTAFGIVTFDLEQHTLVDSYFIGPEATEVNVTDITFENDSIYAFTADYVAKAATKDNIVDYRVWERVIPSACHVHPDANKGKIIADAQGNIWKAGGTNGIICESILGEQLTYKPDGPLQNTPYRITYQQGRLYMVPGGRWATQSQRPGCIMIYNGANWINITNADIKSILKKDKYLDFMNVAVDPHNAKHFYVTSYGTGLYEFENDTLLVRHLPAASNTIVSAVPADCKYYTRLDGAIFDQDDNLLFLTAGAEEGTLITLSKDSIWGRLRYYVNNEQFTVHTPGELIIHNQNPDIKIIPYCRYNTGVLFSNDNGTLLEESDDLTIFRKSWMDQKNNVIEPENIYAVRQMSNGNLWIATNMGPILVPTEVDWFESNQCVRTQLQDGDAFLMEKDQINDFAEDYFGNVWIATNTMGVYVLSEDAQNLVAHYTTDNSNMPSNNVNSLCFDRDHKLMYIGTSEGLVSCLDTIPPTPSTNNQQTNAEPEYGTMLQWRLHPSYSEIQSLYVAKQNVYALASGSLFSVNKQTEEVTQYSKIDGMHGSKIVKAAYNENTNQLLVVYANGIIDIIDDNSISYMLDIYQKASSMSTNVHDIYMHKSIAYLAMPFGVVAINLQKHEISDTYYIGENAKDIDVEQIVCTTDSIYALSGNAIYYAALTDNLVDYSHWKSAPVSINISKLVAYENQVYALAQNTIYQWKERKFNPFIAGKNVQWMKTCAQQWLCSAMAKTYQIQSNGNTTEIPSDTIATDIDYDTSTGAYWQVNARDGLVRMTDGQKFAPQGPQTNDGYTLQFFGNRLFVCPGGRWANRMGRPANISIYENDEWKGWNAKTVTKDFNAPIYDLIRFAANPNNPSDFFAASYGNGLLQYKDDKPYMRYTEGNSSLMSAVAGGDYWDYYVRVDGLHLDNQGYLWMLNADSRPHTVNILDTASMTWTNFDIYSNGTRVSLATPGEILPDQRDERYKWLYGHRLSDGVILFYDGGTPIKHTDDKAIRRNTFYDQDNNQIVLTDIYCLTQDKKNDIWIGTPSGIVVIPASVDFMTSSTCQRIKIPRNDGTNLADYLLGTEQINCIAIDGGNRKWIGTQTSGVYLVSEDGLTTIEHFTENNSPLPSNSVLSIAIHPITGEVFFGTTDGIASYQSDASEPQEDFDNVYAYPNPVRSNYEGTISITGLMDNTVINIIDAGGNLICKTRSNGGTAIWDGKDQYGRRAATGVYTVLCNTANGKNHTVTKILILN